MPTQPDRPPVIGVAMPYWTFWEASAGGPAFRVEREKVLEEIVLALQDNGFETISGGLLDGAEAGEHAAERFHESVDVTLIVQSMATPPTHALACLDRLLPTPTVIWAIQLERTIESDFDAASITRLGSTVGVPMLTNVLRRSRRPFDLIVGPPDSEIIIDLHRALRAAWVASTIQRARIGRVGRPIPGYACCDVEEVELEALGLELVDIEPSLFREYFKSADASALTNEIEELEIDDALDTLDDTLLLAEALAKMDDDHNLSAGAMNCHVPEIRFSEEPGITPCFALGRETSRGVPWTCAGDVLTAIAMLIAKRLGGAALYHEIEAIDFETGEVALANSGEHDLEWCRQDLPPCIGPNPWFASDARTGGSLRFDLPPGPATLIGFTVAPDDPGGLRIIVAEGDVSERRLPMSPTVGGLFRFSGRDVTEAWIRWVESGVNHHSACAPGHLGNEVDAVARHLGVGFMRVA